MKNTIEERAIKGLVLVLNESECYRDIVGYMMSLNSNVTETEVIIKNGGETTNLRELVEVNRTIIGWLLRLININVDKKGVEKKFLNKKDLKKLDTLLWNHDLYTVESVLKYLEEDLEVRGNKLKLYQIREMLDELLLDFNISIVYGGGQGEYFARTVSRVLEEVKDIVCNKWCKEIALSY